MASRKIPASLNPPAVLLTSKRHFFGDFLCASKESFTPQAEALFLKQKIKTLDPCLLVDDEQEPSHWIPAFAGMTSRSQVTGFPPARDDERVLSRSHHPHPGKPARPAC